MVDLLVADIATAKRGGADFPFVRNFDHYEGHSWASGIGLGPFGNNQESSSEAINAWAGLILWAQVNGDTALRDLGVYLYTTEIESINHYWFDIHHLVFPSEYQNVETSMLFGANTRTTPGGSTNPARSRASTSCPSPRRPPTWPPTPRSSNAASQRSNLTPTCLRRAAKQPSPSTSGKTCSPNTWDWPMPTRVWRAGTAGAHSSSATPEATRCTG